MHHISLPAGPALHQYLRDLGLPAGFPPPKEMLDALAAAYATGDAALVEFWKEQATNKQREMMRGECWQQMFTFG